MTSATPDLRCTFPACAGTKFILLGDSWPTLGTGA